MPTVEKGNVMSAARDMTVATHRLRQGNDNQGVLTSSQTLGLKISYCSKYLQ